MPSFARHAKVLILAIALALVALPCLAQGQRRPAPERVEHDNRGERRAEHRALSDAVRRVERATDGQVLSAERVQFDGRDVSRVKVVDGRGRVRVYWDDPQARRGDQAPRSGDEQRQRTRRDDGDDPTL